MTSQHYSEYKAEMRWMNERAVGRAAYNPSTVEHLANIITHAVS